VLDALNHYFVPTTTAVTAVGEQDASPRTKLIYDQARRERQARLVAEDDVIGELFLEDGDDNP
jgi:hypothetical protein